MNTNRKILEANKKVLSPGLEVDDLRPFHPRDVKTRIPGNGDDLLPFELRHFLFKYDKRGSFRHGNKMFSSE
jgi:signal recognition particle GTPase